MLLYSHQRTKGAGLAHLGQRDVADPVAHTLRQGFVPAVTRSFVGWDDDTSEHVGRGGARCGGLLTFSVIPFLPVTHPQPQVI